MICCFIHPDSSNSPHHLCLLVYRIPPGFHPTIKVHGNSKVAGPFHPTWPSTKEQIKEQCLVKGPESTLSSISIEAGGIIGASAPGLLPRDEKQVSNFKRKLAFQSRISKISGQGISRDAAADELFVVMQQAYSDDPSHRFIRAVNAAPEPAIVLATNSQLRDLVRFCTSPFEFSVLTVDPTFCLGDFDVTLITSRHLFLQSKRYHQSPVFVGPSCIHFRKNFSAYLFFASTLIGQCKELEGVRAVGTDGEQALIDAFKHEFGFSQHLTCFLHVRRNMKEKLRECNIPSQVTIDILNDTFGNKLGSVYVNGLVDADDTEDFDIKVKNLISKWRGLQCTSTSDMEGFINWFQTFKVPVIRNSMIQPVREECGLGSPPAQFTTNASETANYMLKHKVDYKRSELPEFLHKFKELIQEQEREVEKAVIGRGKFELRTQYRSWYVPESKWFTMTTSQREQHLRKFSEASLSDVSQSDNSAKDGTPHISVGRDSSTLSVRIEVFANAVRVPINSLEGIWNKASELLKTENAIVPAPGNPNAKLVLSYKGPRPHLVTQKKDGNFVCDSDCPNWKGLGICAHAIAVAELCHKLPEFVEKFKSIKKAPNLTKFADVTMPRGRGRKGNVASRKRKASTPIETHVDNPSLMSPSTTSGQDSSAITVSQTNSVVHMNPNEQITQSNFQTLAGNSAIYNWPSTSPQFSPPPWPHSSPGTLTPPFFYQPFTPSPSSSPFPQPFPFNQSQAPSTPFSLCKISGNISVCAGCRNKYSKTAGPPEDMCIRHQEWREYTSPGSQTPARRYGNVYYHFDPQCVWHRCAAFIPSQLQIPPEVMDQLDQSHKVKLAMVFNINIPA